MTPEVCLPQYQRDTNTLAAWGVDASRHISRIRAALPSLTSEMFVWAGGQARLVQVQWRTGQPAAADRCLRHGAQSHGAPDLLRLPLRRRLGRLVPAGR
eukprot:COSAG04_NODE_494_length_13425_cov_65.898619_3_plen_99_part_00